MFEQSEAEMIETIVLSKRSGTFGSIEVLDWIDNHCRVTLHNGKVFEVYQSRNGWEVSSGSKIAINSYLLYAAMDLIERI